MMMILVYDYVYMRMMHVDDDDVSVRLCVYICGWYMRMMMMLVYDYVYMRPLADWNVDTHPAIVGPGKDMVVVETHSGTTSSSPKFISRFFLDTGTGNRKLNFPYIILQGIAIGDGLCDPISMTGYGDLLHAVGLINRFHQCHLDHWYRTTILS